MQEAWVPKSNLFKFEEKMERLVKKANKLGLPAPTYEITSDVKLIDVPVSPDHTAKVTHVRCTVDGEFPKLPGWNLVAVITHERHIDWNNEESWNKVDVVPGVEVSKSLRTAAPDCDHCKTKRYRKVTYLLENDKGSYRAQVGSTCVEDFLGGKSPEAILNQERWLKMFKEVFTDDLIGPGAGYVPEYDLVSILAFTNVVIEAHGWMSKGKAEEEYAMPTSEYVYSRMIDGSDYYTRNLRKTNDDDRAEARKAIEWMLTHDINEAEDYIYNCLLLCKSGWIIAKELGLACSILGSYKNHVRREAERKARESRKPSAHVGNVGDRLTHEAEFVWEYVGDSSWGTYAIMKFVTDAGEVLVWKSSPQSIERGDRVKLTGTVKKHAEFRDEKQTELTRCKLEVL